LVSTTTRAPPTPRTDGLHFRVNLPHRHRFDAGLGYAICNREQGIRGSLTSDRLVKQASERPRRQQAGRTRGFGGRVGQLDLDFRHALASSFRKYMVSGQKSK
jgi:hypothetical protein